ncbi:MAG: heme ABC transporter ATP-binding protein [Tardiphaga sp.]
MTAMLEARDIGVTLGRAKLLDGVDVQVARGETVAIVGPNGAGKSTLLRVLSGDQRATRGHVKLKGRELHDWNPAELAQHRAMLSQHVSVSFAFTVAEIVQMGRGSMPLAAAQPFVDAAIDEVGLADFHHRELPTLSGGEQQRAHFARVLVQLACGEAAHGPGVLLLDEPTSSLDLRHQIALVDLSCRRARNGTAIVAVLHDLNLAARFAERIIVMQDGNVAAMGTPRETITRSVVNSVFNIDTAIAYSDQGNPYLLPHTMQQSSSSRPELG